MVSRLLDDVKRRPSIKRGEHFCPTQPNPVPKKTTKLARPVEGQARLNSSHGQNKLVQGRFS
jgi:hypothetical protein